MQRFAGCRNGRRGNDDYFLDFLVLIVVFFLVEVVELRVLLSTLFVFVIVEVFHLFFVLQSDDLAIKHLKEPPVVNAQSHIEYPFLHERQ